MIDRAKMVAFLMVPLKLITAICLIFKPALCHTANKARLPTQIVTVAFSLPKPVAKRTQINNCSRAYSRYLRNLYSRTQNRRTSYNPDFCGSISEIQLESEPYVKNWNRILLYQSFIHSNRHSTARSSPTVHKNAL